jgi:hypothetical protein
LPSLEEQNILIKFKLLFFLREFIYSNDTIFIFSKVFKYLTFRFKSKFYFRQFFFGLLWGGLDDHLIFPWDIQLFLYTVEKNYHSLWIALVTFTFLN